MWQIICLELIICGQKIKYLLQWLDGAVFMTQLVIVSQRKHFRTYPIGT